MSSWQPPPPPPPPSSSSSSSSRPSSSYPYPMNGSDNNINQGNDQNNGNSYSGGQTSINGSGNFHYSNKNRNLNPPVARPPPPFQTATAVTTAVSNYPRGSMTNNNFHPPPPPQPSSSLSSSSLTSPRQPNFQASQLPLRPPPPPVPSTSQAAPSPRFSSMPPPPPSQLPNAPPPPPSYHHNHNQFPAANPMQRHMPPPPMNLNTNTTATATANFPPNQLPNPSHTSYPPPNTFQSNHYASPAPRPPPPSIMSNKPFMNNLPPATPPQLHPPQPPQYTPTKQQHMSQQNPPQYPPQNQQQRLNSNQTPPPPLRPPPPPQSTSNNQMASPSPKIHPSQIPRPPSFHHPLLQPAQIYRTKYSIDTSTSSSATPPPLASSRYITIDDGNASPRLIRSTTFFLPANQSVLDKTGLPMAALLTPMYGPPDSSESIPPLMNGKVNLSNNARTGAGGATTTTTANNNNNNTDSEGNNQSPIKCRHCHAYINPFVKWQDPTQSSSFSFTSNKPKDGYGTFECNFCGTFNTIPEPPHMWSTKKGTVEYLVDGQYITSKDGISLARNIHLYALDCSDVFLSTPQHPQQHPQQPQQQPQQLYGKEESLWKEYLKCVSDVAESLNDAYEQEMKERKWSLDGEEVHADYRPRIGFFLIMPNDEIVIPYLKGKKPSKDGEVTVVDDHNEDEFEPSLVTMADVHEDPFAPLPISQWTFDVTLDHDMKSMQNLMSCVPTLFTQFEEQQQQQQLQQPESLLNSCGGSALAVLVNALMESGGRGTLITSSRPNRGIGKINNRERLSFLYTRSLEEHSVCTPIQLLKEKDGEGDGKHEESAKFYRVLGESCQQGKVSIDILIVSKEEGDEKYLDSATLAEFCKTSCGKFKIIPNHIHSTPFGDVLKEEMIRSATQAVAYDAILKLRCSSGIRVKSYLNPPGKVFDDGITSPELELSSVSSDTCICAILEHQVGGIKIRNDLRSFAYLQSVLLYTTPHGQRKLRVSTLALPVTDLVPDVFRGSDFGCIAALWTRHAVVAAKENGLKRARMDVIDSCVNVLSQYRLNTSAKDAPMGQLILPEALQLLPLFCMSIRKSGLLRAPVPPGTSLSTAKHPQPCVDERMHMMYHASNMSPDLPMLLVHPNVYDLTRLKGTEGFEYTPKSNERGPFVDEACKPYLQLPQTIHPSIALLEDDCVYLMDDGFTLFLFVGKSVSQELRLELFGSESNANSSTKYQLKLTSEYGQRIQRIIQNIRECSSSRPTFPPMIVYVNGEGNGHVQKQKVHGKIMTLLVDDTTSQEKGYVDFLCSLHRKIRQKLDGK